MALALGDKLSIRSQVYVAGEAIPFFWPMRSFIHHNPLHGLEKLPFEKAVKVAKKLFHARTYLARGEYQRYQAQGQVCSETLSNSIKLISNEYNDVTAVDLQQVFNGMLSRVDTGYTINDKLLDAELVLSILNQDPQKLDVSKGLDRIQQNLREQLPVEKPIYETIDLLCGTTIGNDLDELVIKSCLEFFDEGQSVWPMPSREKGFFRAWVDMATQNSWLSKRARAIRRLVDSSDSPEDVIATVMRQLQVPEDAWTGYFTNELSRLHGWVGFIRWRESAKHYYWNREYPGDLVDYVAVRMALTSVILSEYERITQYRSVADIARDIEQNVNNTYLRFQLYSGDVLPAMAQEIEEKLAVGNEQQVAELNQRYVAEKLLHDARQCAEFIAVLPLGEARQASVWSGVDAGQFERMLNALRDFEIREGQLWLNAMEASAARSLLEQVKFEKAVKRDKRPFVQALFCIDTRSERIRRHLESVGDYQTYGIAGFFGVPLSFLELGKGSETHLCPILLTPKNLVLEISRDEYTYDKSAIGTLEKVMHDLKESILTPFVTVEAIGLLFGLDMIGKTIAPIAYQRLRQRLHPAKPATHLLQDKLSREQADSIVRAVQRAVIVNAVEYEMGLPTERLTDDMVRELRECALGHQETFPKFLEEVNKDVSAVAAFIERLQTTYKINASFARFQLEQLGRIGFSLDEQVGFVSQALRGIGLTRQFSRFVLLVGHGSQSENNPYESALDCGACGGNHGLTNARVLAYMANKPKVREKLRQQGMELADDVWFMPAMHNTTTDELKLYDMELLPSSHLIYIDRLRTGLKSAARLCASERLPTLQPAATVDDPAKAYASVQKNAVDWSQVRPEWGLSRNAYFIIGQRELTRGADLEGRSFLHSYNYQDDRKGRLLENILGGPLVVGQWINMEHYFSAVDNEKFGSGSKVYHNVAGRFGVMAGNLSDLRTGLPAQTVLKNGMPYHDPVRLITVIQAPYTHAIKAIEAVVAVKRLIYNNWIRMIVIDPVAEKIYSYADGQWLIESYPGAEVPMAITEESVE